jgi:hypothetical protein
MNNPKDLVNLADVKQAFELKKRNRHWLLYLFYQDYFTSSGFTAEFIAQKISADSSLSITPRMIRHIFYNVIPGKQTSSEPVQTSLPNTATENRQISGVNTSETEIKKVQKSQPQIHFKNEDELGKKSSLDEQFEGV